jgi:exopolysaccharide biosynthesis polyprenyl glycosylphosphotransferase
VETAATKIPLGRQSSASRSISASPREFDNRRATAGNERSWGRELRFRLLLTDALVIGASVVLAQILWLELPGHHVLVAGLGIPYTAVTAVLGLVWLIALGTNQSRSVPMLGSGTDEYRRVIEATFSVFGLFATCAMLLKIDLARGLLAVALPLGLFALLATRHLWRLWLRGQRSLGAYSERALLVGRTADVAFVAERILKAPDAGYRLIGAAISAAHGENEASSLSIGRAHSIPVIADPDNIVEAVNRHNIDAVIIAGTDESRTALRELGWALGQTGTVLVVASKVGDISGPRINWRPVEGLPLMRISLPAFEGSKYILKRAFDVLAAGVGLLCVLPLMLLVAAAIRLDSAGPVFFRQERIGLNGKPFWILKFRSMYMDADKDVAGVLDSGMRVFYKAKSDPRITKVGAFIRKYSLDELPQLWNVLRGDMSLVGPRPQINEEVELYDSAMNRRLLVKPGITGLWQVSGRSDLDLNESVRLDLYYTENWSLAGDLTIIMRTVRAVAKGSGAY